MNYLVARFGDRIQGETAYSALETAGFTAGQIAILGKGYKTVTEYGLFDPNLEIRKRAIFMAFWLVPFGLFGGFTFSLITGLETFAWAGTWGNHLIGALLGAASGALGSFAASGGIGLIFAGANGAPYQKQLDTGKYLVVVKGSETRIRKATEIVRPLKPEDLQGYAEPGA